MAKSPPVETSLTPQQAAKIRNGSDVSPHPFDFHVSGPRNLSTPNWRDLIRSSWKDPNYRRMVIACFIQAVYLQELDRQEQKDENNGLASKWYKPFKYRLTQTLIDQRDGSIYGAVFEWDRYAAMSDLVLVRPSGAPRAVLSLRGTLLKSPTIRRDLQDDLRYLAWESLKGSVRFNGTLNALNALVSQFGSTNVCIGGHSLGAGFAFQVGKALAKLGIFVECHLFNPPSVSVARSLISFGERAGSLWEKVRARYRGSGMVRDEVREMEAAGLKWMPYLYVNNCDYICCYYNDVDGTAKEKSVGTGKEGSVGTGKVESVGTTLSRIFVMSKGPQKFLEAHGLEQWWADDAELQVALNHSKLINQQLRSLYSSGAQSSPQLSKP
ncbi:hypothetical protein LUZ60_008199 [Juncus effusus]|nr:hypothetical protein LUZ60_008199 [Juncus effusus]